MPLHNIGKRNRKNDLIITVHTDVLLKDIKKTDLIIIPAIGGNLKKALEINKDFRFDTEKNTRLYEELIT